MQSGSRLLREKDSIFKWDVFEGDVYQYKTLVKNKNIDELIIHLSIIKEKGFTHVDSEMLGVRFLTKSEVILQEIEYLNNRAEQLKQELDGIR